MLVSQLLFRKLEAMRLVDNFLSLLYHLSYELRLRWVFFILMEKKVLMHQLKIGAAVNRCSSKWVFLKHSQYSQENTCVRVSSN